MKLHIMLAAVLTAAFSASAAEPSGYYDSCKGKSGAQLLKALEGVISSHTNVGYSGLWELYKTADVDANGKIWDMYSTKRWNPGKEQCGNYSSVGDCYNREHSLPKSWFNDAAPMYSDGFHIYPTDGKVNGQRSNYPYGECAGGTTLSASGGVKALGRLGASTFPGYSGTVFEPDDEYKGDFARSYFYMAACYNSRISSWNSDMLAGNAFPVFTDWAKNLLMKWHQEDPVSDKERARNDAVYAEQHNRNPFIDHPDLADHIWGSQSSAGWGSTVTVKDPAFTSPVAGTTVDFGTVAVGRKASVTINVRGTDFTQAVSVSASGTGFSVTPASLTAAAVNGGASVSVALTPAAPGSCRGTLTLSSGNATVSVTLTGEAVAGLTALQPANVTQTSFTACWLHDASSASASYKLNVMHDGSLLAGYPKDVKATDEAYNVTGLEPSTTYTYYLTDGATRTNTITAVTRGETPELYLEPGNDLVFSTSPGVASAPITVFVDAYNVDGDIAVSVSNPFEVSLDKKSWASTVTLGEDDGQLYLRLNGQTPGVYHTALRAQAEGCYNDDLEAEGVIESQEPVKESFEKDANFGYQGVRCQGDAARWDFSGAGVFGDSREVRTGHQGVRFNASEGGSVTMSEPFAGGVAEVTYHTRQWDEGAARVVLEYSLDGAASWTEAASAVPGKEWTATTARINAPGAVSLRLIKTEGARVGLDDIEITPMQAKVEIPEAVSGWDATAYGEAIVINNCGLMRSLAVYDLDGRCLWRATVPEGTTVIPMVRGHYVVVSGDESRRVVVR
ncbi:MAG: hypothetical protein HDS11_05945 [Bacteroides sp.]|nr:hypothetical protein [Bacteroides sp.]